MCRHVWMNRIQFYLDSILFGRKLCPTGFNPVRDADMPLNYYWCPSKAILAFCYSPLETHPKLLLTIKKLWTSSTLGISLAMCPHNTYYNQIKVMYTSTTFGVSSAFLLSVLQNIVCPPPPPPPIPKDWLWQLSENYGLGKKLRKITISWKLKHQLKRWILLFSFYKISSAVWRCLSWVHIMVAYQVRT